MPTYRCPECGFSGKLGELTNHLRNNPSHWHVRCQECGDSLVTKKDFVNHEQKTGHAPVGVEISDITNVQKTTRVKDTVKGPTKNKLIRLGFSDESASFLATGRNWMTLIGMSKGATTKLTKKLDGEEKELFYELVRPDLTKNQPKLSTKKQSSGDWIVSFPKLAQSFSKNMKFASSKKLQKFLFKGEHAPIRISYQVVGMTLSNFKGFRNSIENPVHVPIRPLTLVYGPNNGGKSSILKGFSSIPQTISKRQSLDGDYDWTPDGPWFNLGGIPQILNNLEEPSFSIGFVIKLSKDGNDDTFKEIRYTYRFESKGSEKNIGILDKIQIYTGDFSDFMDLTLELSVEKGKSEETKFVRTSPFFGSVVPVGQENKKLEVTFMNDRLSSSVDRNKTFRKHVISEIERFRQILQDLEEEGWLAHKSINKFACPYCPKTFNKDKKAIRHLSTHHTDELEHMGLIQASKETLKEMLDNKMRAFTLNTKLTSRLREFLFNSPEKYGSQEASSSTFFRNIMHWFDCLMILDGFDLESREGWPDGIKHYQVSEKYDLNKTIEEGHMTAFFDLDDVKIYAKWGLTVDINHLSGENEFVKELRSVRKITNKIIQEGFQNTDYLSATRLIPQRNYSSRTGGKSTQGVTGERTLALLANDEELQKWVNERLGEMIGLNIIVNNRQSEVRLADGSVRNYPTDELDVRVVRVGFEEDRLQLPDVGFGVSQLLPILTALKADGKLIIEEPESNLHPAAQQKLMQTIISQINDNSQIIMETHSEHFLLEVLRAISDPENSLTDDDVSILYTYNTPEEGTQVKRHTTTNGVLDERFPVEFTGDYKLSII